MEQQNNFDFLSFITFFSLKKLVNSSFLATFALVNELDRHIEILLLSNECVIVPDFGGFMAHQVDARYDGRDNMFLPPLRTIGFNPQLKMNDSLLAQSYVEAYDISYPDALHRISEEVAEIRQHLENAGKYELNNIGTIFLNENGNYTFEPCEAGILTPELYGLGGFTMLPLSQTQPEASIEATSGNESVAEFAIHTQENEQTAEIKALNPSVFDEDESEEEEKGAEFVQIKKSVLRNVAAACIAIIAFFALSTPLNKTSVQMGKVDTNLLTRLMPKDLVKTESKPTALTSDNISSLNNKKISLNEEANDEDKKEITSAKPYYGIVLASRVTKRNAASYVERLQSQGLKDVKVIITATNVKVVYGSYDTEAQAYSALNRLHNNEIFSDGWITKVKE